MVESAWVSQSLLGDSKSTKFKSDFVLVCGSISSKKFVPEQVGASRQTQTILLSKNNYNKKEEKKCYPETATDAPK